MTDSPRGDSKEIYGLWRRAAPRRELDAYEVRSRDADEAFDLRHPDVADALDAMRGRVVRLRRAREGIPDPDTGEGRVYPKGCRFEVTGRVRDWLLVTRDGMPCPLLVRPEWVDVT